MSFQFYVVHTVAQVGGLHSTEMRSCFDFLRAHRHQESRICRRKDKWNKRYANMREKMEKMEVAEADVLNQLQEEKRKVEPVIPAAAPYIPLGTITGPSLTVSRWYLLSIHLNVLLLLHLFGISRHIKGKCISWWIVLQSHKYCQI